ncbi:MAG: nicotinamide riboside transporter PnuC [Patescibacteria group bacterium]
MPNIFSLDFTLFTLLGYPMSFIEFAGTLFNIACVWLVVRKNIWNWPIGNIGVVLFAILFYKIQLYSDFVEQIYFLITGFYGWWAWSKWGRRRKTGAQELPVSRNTPKSNWRYGVVIVVGSICMGYLVGHLHIYFPSLFPVAASFPYLDAVTTVMSFAATILMAHKKVESWYLWIAVDVIGIGLYYSKGVIFVSLLYVIFLALATKGLLVWQRSLPKSSPTSV